jgi:hypothetical protein
VLVDVFVGRNERWQSGREALANLLGGDADLERRADAGERWIGAVLLGTLAGRLTAAPALITDRGGCDLQGRERRLTRRDGEFARGRCVRYNICCQACAAQIDWLHAALSQRAMLGSVYRP